MPENPIIMKKKIPTKKLSKRVEYCKSLADKIHRINPTLIQVESAMSDLWAAAYKEGYREAISDMKNFRNSREKILYDDFQRLRDTIEDKIHQNK